MSTEHLVDSGELRARCAEAGLECGGVFTYAALEALMGGCEDEDRVEGVERSVSFRLLCDAEKEVSSLYRAAIFRKTSPAPLPQPTSAERISTSFPLLDPLLVVHHVLPYLQIDDIVRCGGVSTRLHRLVEHVRITGFPRDWIGPKLKLAIARQHYSYNTDLLSFLQQIFGFDRFETARDEMFRLARDEPSEGSQESESVYSWGDRLWSDYGSDYDYYDD